MALVRDIENLGLEAVKTKRRWTIRHVRARDNKLIHHACRHGWLDVLKWLASTFPLERKDFKDYKDYVSLLADALNGGHTDVANWLHDKDYVDYKQATSAIKRLLFTRQSDEESVLRGLHWLEDKRYTKADVLDYRSKMRTLRHAIQRGWWHVAEWIVATFHVTEDECKRSKALIDLCSDPFAYCGKPEKLQWLINTFPGLESCKFAKKHGIVAENILPPK